jgi:hypothetical protein
MLFGRKNREIEVVRRLEFKDLRGAFRKYIILDETRYLLEVEDGEPQPLFTGGRRSFSIKDLFLSKINPSRLMFYIMDASMIHGVIKVMDDEEKRKKMYKQKGSRETYVSEYSLVSKDHQPIQVSINLGVNFNNSSGERLLRMIKSDSLTSNKDVLYSRSIWTNLDTLICGDVLAGIVSQRIYEDIVRDTDKITEEAVGKVRGGSNEITSHQEYFGYGITEVSLNWHLTPLDQRVNVITGDVISSEQEFTYGEFFIWLGVILLIFGAILAWIYFGL